MKRCGLDILLLLILLLLLRPLAFLHLSLYPTYQPLLPYTYLLTFEDMGLEARVDKARRETPAEGGVHIPHLLELLVHLAVDVAVGVGEGVSQCR